MKDQSATPTADAGDEIDVAEMDVGGTQIGGVGHPRLSVSRTRGSSAE